MAFRNMWTELAQDLGSMPAALARTRIQEAYGTICDENLWSFQLAEAGWLTPGLLSAGTITATPYSNQIVADAVATAAWLALTGRPLLTERQFRVPNYSLYNIVAYESGQTAGQGNYPYATLTLDRPWMEPAQTAQGYMIYQAYYPAPVADFKRFIAVSNYSLTRDLDFREWKQQDLDVHDPQRTIFQDPTRVVPYQVDTRPGSATLGTMLYELWPHPLAQVSLKVNFVRRGVPLVLPTDTVPYPLTEELVKWRAKEIGYQWKESQKGEDMQRGSGANWQFLSQAANAEYNKLLKQVQHNDRNLVDLYTTKLRRRGGTNGSFLNSSGTRLTLGL